MFKILVALWELIVVCSAFSRLIMPTRTQFLHRKVWSKVMRLFEKKFSERRAYVQVQPCECGTTL